MSVGFAHIIKLGEVGDSGGLRIPQYQFTYDDGQNTYARTFDETGLGEFLRDDIGLRPDLLDAVMSDLRSGENAILKDVHIAENEASVMGLMQAPSDV